jgi:hypothetical protein
VFEALNVMKTLIPLIFLFFCFNSEATTCIAYNPKPGEEISVIKSETSPQLYFKAPLIAGGSDLQVMYLRAFHLGKEKNGTQMFLPIAFESERDSAKAQLWLMPEFVKVRIEAKYGTEQCGPRLYLDVHI